MTSTRRDYFPHTIRYVLVSALCLPLLLTTHFPLDDDYRWLSIVFQFDVIMYRAFLISSASHSVGFDTIQQHNRNWAFHGSFQAGFAPQATAFARPAGCTYSPFSFTAAGQAVSPMP